MSKILPQPTSESTPPSSRPRTRNSRCMTLDLSSLPPLSLPAPPSNTLIITNVGGSEFFESDQLSEFKDLISQSGAIHSWAPLKSFRRIIVSFFDVDTAMCVRQSLESLGGVSSENMKIYFGQATPVEPKESHLNLPDAGKLFFISPPPSPPHGWQSKAEDAPNKQVVAHDLAEALRNLNTNSTQYLDSPISDSGDFKGRARSASCKTIYRPEEHGGSPNLPAINVEDTTGDGCEISPIECEKPIFAHTCRPPLELMKM